jgi:prevent-host-death family protein
MRILTIMSARKTIPAAEFTRNFGQYRMRAQREPVAVSSHGRITGYFVGAEEYEEFERFRESRRSFATVELSEEKVKGITASRMNARHAHLDTLLKRKRK